MPILQDIFQFLNRGEHLTSKSISEFNLDSTILDFQKASVVANIFFNGIPTEAEKLFVNQVIADNNTIKKYHDILHGVKSTNSFEVNLLCLVLKNETVGKNRFTQLIKRIADKSIDKVFLSFLLMAIKHKGLKKEDMFALTISMSESGKTYDYRNNQSLDKRKIVRRYPTGALSEKIALIMPSLLMAFYEDLAISSPFLVAKSLSFTGGTWDKLSAIPGFKFPKQGKETTGCLKECGIAMTVTVEDFNPADKFLYQFRSVTNTVESHELIVSSIASKQINVPADSLILDIRYGEGAFLKDFLHAKELEKDLKEILGRYGIKSKGVFTEACQPNGSCIGNYWEVIEAIAIMKNRNKCFGFSFNRSGVEEQKKMVIDMTCELLALEFESIGKLNIQKVASKFFEEGAVIKSFYKLLKSHGVNDEVINAIKNDKTWVNNNFVENRIMSPKDGTLTEVKQKELGNFVNFELGGGFNDFMDKTNFFSGIKLEKRKMDKVKKGDILATVMHFDFVGEDLLQPNRYFRIDND